MPRLTKNPVVKKTLRQKVMSFFLHFISMCILFALPEVLMSLGKHRAVHIDALMYVKPLLLVAVFYTNYYIIFPYTYGKRRWVLRIVVYNAVLLTGAIFLESQMMNIAHTDISTPPPAPHREFADMHRFQPPWALKPLIFRDIAMYILTASLSVTIRLSLGFVELERRHSEQLARQRTEELNKLKEQLRPHFLFNALNTIYALIDIDAPMAKNAVHRISQMLRYVLYDTASTVKLQKEIEFIEHYVKLMSLRMPASTPVTAVFDAGRFADSPISPLMFINIIENAFKHGRTGRDGEGIDISITTDQCGVVTCETHNYISDTPDQSSQGGGMGLVNLRRRIELLYAGDAELTTESDGNTFHAKLTIKLNSEK